MKKHLQFSGYLKMIKLNVTGNPDSQILQDL